MSTEANPQRVAQAIDGHLSEFLDGYLLVGFVAGDNKAILVARIHDEKTKAAIQLMLEQAQVMVSTHGS